MVINYRSLEDNEENRRNYSGLRREVIGCFGFNTIIVKNEGITDEGEITFSGTDIEKLIKRIPNNRVIFDRY